MNRKILKAIAKTKQFIEKKRMPLPKLLEQSIKRVENASNPRAHKLVREYRWNTDSLKIGRKFIYSFKKQEIKTKKGDFKIETGHTLYESPIGIQLFFRPSYYRGEYNLHVGAIKLNFAEIKGLGKCVLIEAIQGNEGVKKESDFFHRTAKKSWQNYLIELATEQAKKEGYSGIGIINPKWLFWYHKPIVSARLENEIKEQQNIIRKRIRKNYALISEKLGFNEKLKTSNAVYMMKRI